MRTRVGEARDPQERRYSELRDSADAPEADLGDEEAPLGDASSRKIDEEQARELEKDRFRIVLGRFHMLWQVFRWFFACFWRRPFV